MLCFKGSDFKRSSTLTWYSKMDNLLMALGFTESKADPNLFFKVEGGRPVMLLLYVDDLLLIGEEKLIKDARRRLATEFEMKYLGMMHYILGMKVWTRELYSRYPEDIWDDGFQSHDHTYGIEPKAIE